MELRGHDVLIAGETIEGCNGDTRALVAELDPYFRKKILWQISEPNQSSAATMSLARGNLVIGGSIRRAVSLDPDDVEALDLSSKSLRLPGELESRDDGLVVEIGSSTFQRRTYLEAGFSTIVRGVAYTNGAIIATGMVGTHALWASLQ
jgi:hypothetical protein